MLFLIMLILSWRAWPDILIDFGRELYLPWQISRGQVLYQDQAHLFGPLSVYYHALLFRLFGPSYTVIIISNLGIFVILLYLLYNLWHRLSRLSAWITILITTSIFGFGQYIGIGNYNFLSPYSHETTHGLVLTTFMIHLLGEYDARMRRRSLAFAGATLGLVFLTRTDLFLAALTTAVGFFAIRIKDAKFKYREMFVFVGMVSIPIFLCLVLFKSRMSLYDAGLALLEPWRVLTTSGAFQNTFYGTVTGFDNPFRNFAKSLLETSSIIILLGTLRFISQFSIERPRWGQIGRVAWLIAITMAILAIAPYEIGRSLPILCAMELIVLFKYRNDFGSSIIKPILWAIFSLAILMRMPLHATFVHYGFYAALPATTLLIGSIVWNIPFWMKTSNSLAEIIVRNLILIAIFILALTFITFSNKVYSLKNFKIGEGEDYFWAFDPKIDTRSLIVEDTLNWIEKNMRQDETFVAIPEGVMLNYLTKHINPTRFFNFMPPELSTYGESTIVEEFIMTPPDYVLIVHKDTHEYGYDFFGKESTYGMLIMDWVNQNYRSICLFGDRPLTSEHFGIEILIHKDQTESSPPCILK